MSAAAVDVAADVLPEKHEATLTAALALRGHAVHKLASGGFLVCWQGHSRPCGDLESLQAFARQVGAVRMAPVHQEGLDGR